MSRAELFRSARLFLAAGVLLLLVGVALNLLVGVDLVNHPMMTGAGWFLEMLGLGGLSGSAYLCLRGSLRRQPAVHKADEAADPAAGTLV
jgi:hypothetical protein